jgi:hypothetical protein
LETFFKRIIAYKILLISGYINYFRFRLLGNDDNPISSFDLEITNSTLSHMIIPSFIPIGIENFNSGIIGLSVGSVVTRFNFVCLTGSCGLKVTIERSNDASSSEQYVFIGSPKYLHSIRFFHGDNMIIESYATSLGVRIYEINIIDIISFNFPSGIHLLDNKLIIKTAPYGSFDGQECFEGRICIENIKPSSFNNILTYENRKNISDTNYIGTIDNIGTRNVCLANGPFDNEGITNPCSSNLYLPTNADCFSHDLCYDCMRCFYSGNKISFKQYCDRILLKHCLQSESETYCSIMNEFVTDPIYEAKEGSCDESKQDLCFATKRAWDRVINYNYRVSFWNRIVQRQSGSDCFKGVDIINNDIYSIDEEYFGFE